MTASDLTPTRPTPEGVDAARAMHGFSDMISALITMNATLTEAALARQAEALRLLKRRQERDVEFFGALSSAQSPLSAMGMLADYWQAGLADWMTEATRAGTSLMSPAAKAEAPAAPERIGVLAEPVAPIPGAPDSAPSAPPAPSKSRATPV